MDWPWLLAVVKRYFHCEPMQMTFGSFMEHIKQIPKLRKWEAGEDISESTAVNPAKKLSTDEFVEKVLAGELDPDALKPKLTKKSDAEKKIEEAKLMRLLKMDNTPQQQMMVPMTYTR